MSFLEARRLLAEFRGGPDLPFLFALSGTPDPFRLYLEAAGAKRGLAASPRFIPFNTLQQHLAGEATSEPEVYLLLPWDLVPEADWRSGVPPGRTTLSAAIAAADRVLDGIRRRPNARLLYLPAPMPPVIGHHAGDLALRAELEAAALRSGAVLVPAEAFSLGSYLASGCPVGGGWLSSVADQIVKARTSMPTPIAKVLVTDLDNTLWRGVIAEDGLSGIGFRPEGTGYRHYIYQTLLARLRQEGVLLAAVSRNDPEVVLPPLRSGTMTIGEADFVAICASYQAKSAQIRELAKQLNLGLDAFAFVDDNSIEREEVSQILPQVRVVAFPERDDELPRFFEELGSLFGQKELTAEDRDRTELYRRRLQGLAPVEAAGADLTNFLAGLKMRLEIHDRSNGDRTRAVQLINKTNQFNANGRRWTPAEVEDVLRGGGRLFGASLTDRTGSHGEIISFLVSPEGIVEAFVMSCRVFQRRVELAFLVALEARGIAPTGIRFSMTERNEPFRQFLRDSAFGAPVEEIVPFDAAAFAGSHRESLNLFEVNWG